MNLRLFISSFVALLLLQVAAQLPPSFDDVQSAPSAFSAMAGSSVLRECVVAPPHAARVPKTIKATNNYLDMKRGIVVLVNFSDCRFAFGDTVATFYDHLFNSDHFSTYNNVGGDYQGPLMKCAGSVREYWRDNSFGKYNPQFDIVGPVDIEMCHDSVRGADAYTSVELVSKTMDQVVKLVDIADYDSNQDGYIDFIVLVAAGKWSNQADGHRGLWPHAWNNHMFDFYSDAMWAGKKVDACAVTSELMAPTYISPVGLFCHEFGHLLGLRDLYTNGTESYYPGYWDLMCSGDGLDRYRTPAGLSIYERMLLGFSEVEAVEVDHSYTLPPLHESNMGYMWKSTVDSSFFMLENRQKVKWDAFLPGHGLLVSRVALPPNDGIPYVGIVRASRDEVGDGVSVVQNTETFPGVGHVRILGPGTASYPYVFDFNSRDNVYPMSFLYDIEENEGVVSFNVVPISATTRLLEVFGQMEATPTMLEKQWQGQNFVWDFYSAGVAECDDSLVVSGLGEKVLKMALPSKVETSNYVGHNVYQLSIGVVSPRSNTVSARITLSYSTDGKKWTTARAITGYQYNEIKPGEGTRIGWSLEEPKPVLYRITVTTSKTNNYLYFEDLKIEYKDDMLAGDVDGNGNVDIDDLNLLINIILELDSDAGNAARADVDGSGGVDIDDVNRLISILLGLR